MKLILRQIALPLRHVFTIAHESTAVQENLLVELRDGPHRGFGEGASLRYYGVGATDMQAALESMRAEIEADDGNNPEALWDRLLPKLGPNRFALCALDEAAHDLWGKNAGNRFTASGDSNWKICRPAITPSALIPSRKWC